jgi:hypothetical protein
VTNPGLTVIRHAFTIQAKRHQGGDGLTGNREGIALTAGRTAHFPLE